MSERVIDFNKKFLYTETNPENIISAKKGSWFFRIGGDFYLNTSGDWNDEWEKLPYRTVILPAVDADWVVKFEHPYELWFKEIDGFRDEHRQLLPKTGWKFFGYLNVFANVEAETSPWTAVPTSSYDPTGFERSRAYDENFYYYKTQEIWYRTPITLFTYKSSDSGNRQEMYNELPFVQAPRYLPVPSNSTDQSGAPYGKETYDDEFYYVKPSTKWKRCTILVFDPSKLAIF